jgi:predicted nicotinamide N-methyase
MASAFPASRAILVPEIMVHAARKPNTYPLRATNDNMPFALPYWHSQAIAREILDSPEAFSGASIVDIGCGCGVASIAAAMAGADVTALDPNLLCLSFTEANARLNDTRVSLLWGTHEDTPECDIILAGGVFHEEHAHQVASLARRRPSIIAVSRVNLWGMSGFREIRVHDIGGSSIHVFESLHSS